MGSRDAAARAQEPRRARRRPESARVLEERACPGTAARHYGAYRRRRGSSASGSSGHRHRRYLVRGPTSDRVWRQHRPRRGRSITQRVAAELMVTDPPYGVEYDPEWRNHRGLSESKRTGKVLNDERADWSAAWALFPGNIAYVWHGALRSIPVAESLLREGFTIRAQIIWAK